MTALLEADGVTVALPGGAAVLRDLRFTLRPGRVMGLVGESGAGKSMIGRLLAGDLPEGFRVASGTLRFAGQDMLGTPAATRRAWLGRDLAFIPQEPQSALNPVRTVGSQMDEHLRRLGLDNRRARAAGLLEAVHLPRAGELLGRYPHQLSGGMCQRVLIAMAFAGAPRLVVADEPTTALDVTVQARVVSVLAELQARHGTGVMFITHDLRLAGQVCDDILVLYAGRAVEYGPARDVLRDPSHPYTRSLLLANPPVRGPARGLHVLPDQMPGLRQLAAMPGCRFAPRCPVAQPDCTQAEPGLAGGAHRAACFHSDLTGRIVPPLAPAHRRPVATADPVLMVAGLAKTYPGRRWGKRQDVHALRPATFQVAAGEFVGIVGESGSGKSTVARLVVGLERPTTGRIVVDGQDTAGGRRTGAAQMVFQNPQSALNPRRRVGPTVTQALDAAGRPGREKQARAAELLAQVGLAAEMAGRYPFQLSGGQRQRVNIARALCVLPRLLVADEIASGLDVSVQAQLLALLLRLRDEMGFAMLFISHDLSVVRYLCDRVLVMHDGEVVETGETERVFAAPTHPYTRRLLDAVPPDEPAPRPAVAAA